MSAFPSVRSSVRMELGSYWADFREIWYLSIFRNSVEKIKHLLKSDKNNGYFTWRPTYILLYLGLHVKYPLYNKMYVGLHVKTDIHFIISRSFLLRMRLFHAKLSRKSNHILCSITFLFFPKSCRLWDNVEKYCWGGQATDDKMAHAHCMPDT